MAGVRELFLVEAGRLDALLARPELECLWEAPSALPGMSVRELTGHVARAGSLVTEEYLDHPLPDSLHRPPAEALLSAAHYYAAVPVDVTDPVHRGVITRGAEIAAMGLPALRDAVTACTRRLALRIHDLPVDQRVVVIASTPMLFDEYLKTRIVELVLHMDDLACSIGVEPPPVDNDVGALIAHLSIDIARLRHGDITVIRALFRRDRQPVDVLATF